LSSNIFDKDEKLLDNTDLCFMLHVSKRTLQRYRREGKLLYIMLGQKIYYKASDVREFVERTGDYWDKKAMDDSTRYKG
jgi:predicted site-specific integrase-resolvase